MTPYLAGGRPHRLPYVQLFDVGNIDLDGSVFAEDNIRGEWNKVCPLTQPVPIPIMEIYLTTMN